MALSRAIDAMDTPTNFLFVGNPVTGKSTILNALIGEAFFQSGVSIAGGLTYKFDERCHGIHTFMDTPGLADVKLRKQAAAAITEALKKGGNFKVFFVVTLEAGRVRPADKTTIELVLQSAPITTCGLIINKLTKPLLKKFENPDHQTEVLKELIAGVDPIKTRVMVYGIPKIEEAEDEDNVVVALPPSVIDFILQMPSVIISSENVTAVQEDRFDAITAKFEQMLAEVKEDNRRLRDAMSSKDAEVERLMGEVQSLKSSSSSGSSGGCSVM